MNKTVYAPFSVLAAFTLLNPQPTHADMIGTYFGTGIGLTSVSGNIGRGLGYGLNAGYFLTPNWGVGAFIRSSSHDRGVTLMSFGAEGVYQLQDFFPGMTFGLTAGEAKFSGGSFDGNYHFMAGPKLYYEIYAPTNYPITLGIDGGLLWSKPATDILSIVHAFLTFKFWF
jgi:hypothetical protein